MDYRFPFVPQHPHDGPSKSEILYLLRTSRAACSLKLAEASSAAAMRRRLPISTVER